MKNLNIKKINILDKISFLLGFFLLALNFSGFFLSLRNEEIYLLDTYPKEALSPKDAMLKLQNRNLSREEIFYLVNDTVNRSIAHYWNGNNREVAKKFNILIPPRENYILYLFSFLHEKLSDWEIYNYKKAIERGVGLCSQQAIIVDQILKEKNIPSKLVGLYGHVVVTAEISKDKWWILDPDYNVVLPYQLEDLEKNPDKAFKYYIESTSKEKANEISNYYGSFGNYVGDDWFTERQKVKFLILKLSYYLKWVIPIIFLIIPFKNYIKTHK